MNYLGFWKRSLAYLIDIIPLTIVTTLIAYFFFGFDDAFHSYIADPRNWEAKAEFISQRNVIRNMIFLVWIFYCTVLESSPWGATLGKRAVGAVVINSAGERLSFGRAFVRNISKLLSAIPLFLGFLWAAFSKEHQAWHDKIAKTRVVYRSDSEEEPIKGLI